MERFRDFVKVVATLSREEFLEQFPHPLLLHSRIPGALDGFAATRLVDSPRGDETIDRFSQELEDFVVLLPNPKPGREFPRKAFVGRDPRRDFVIAHTTVSNRHACIFCEPDSDGWKLVDSGSTNGTQLRGRPVSPGEPVVLRDADVITFGKVNFLFFTPDGGYRFMTQYRLFRNAMRK
jgi:hypothetical protein